MISASCDPRVDAATGAGLVDIEDAVRAEGVDQVSAMQIDEVVSLVAGEPERIVTRMVWATQSDEIAKAAKPGGLRMLDFFATSEGRAQQREVRYRHILGEPASQQEIDAWQARHPEHSLPADLQPLVMRMNGIHLWANAETGRSYLGLAPIEEWDVARVKMYGPSAQEALLGDHYIALSYHQDGAAFVALDIQTGKYFLMDSSGPDASSPIAENADELLDWLWRSRIPPEG